jgi:hypothetical protein
MIFLGIIFINKKMNRFFLFLILIFPIPVLHAQSQVYSIPLKKKWATDFHFVSDSNKTGCLYLDLNDAYQFILIDSNYKTIDAFTGRFNSSIKQELVGVTAGDGVFDFFFRKVDNDVFTIISVNAHKLKLDRINSFEIAENKKEKVLISGWMGWENSMMSIAKTGDRILLNVFLPGLEIKERSFLVKGSDIDFLEHADCVQAEVLEDSLWLMLKRDHVKYKSPKHRLFLVDLKSGNYRTVDFNCDLNKNREYYAARVRYDVVVTRGCTEYLRIYDKFTGAFLTEVQIDGMMITSNKNIPILKYNYDHVFDTIFGAGLGRGGQYLYLPDVRRDNLHPNAKPVISIIEVDSVKYYRATFRPYRNDPFEPTYRAFVAINPDDYSPDFEKEVPAEKLNQQLTYYIDRDREIRFKKAGYFFGFDDKKCLGYIPKGKKEFRIEILDF